MDSSTEKPQLRSLRIGEIFDRATTMYVRNFSVFSLMILTLLAPMALVEYLMLGRQSADLSQIISQLSHPGTVPAATSNAALLLPAFALTFATLLLAPYVNNAVAAGVAMLYDGEPPNYAAAFRRVFARGWQLLATIVLCGLLLLFVYIGMILALLVVSVIFGAIFAAVGMRAAVLAIVIIGALITLAAIVLVALACVFALYATTLENAEPWQAVRQALARLFNRHEVRKALLMTLSYVALELIVFVVSGSMSVLILSVVHSSALDIVVETVARAVLNAYITILLAVYYFDVRTRAEGLDLEVEIARLSSAQ